MVVRQSRILMRRWIGTFAEYRYEAGQLTDLGSGAVLAAMRARPRAAKPAALR